MYEEIRIKAVMEARRRMILAMKSKRWREIFIKLITNIIQYYSIDYLMDYLNQGILNNI
jgi:hypothetical protein